MKTNPLSALTELLSIPSVSAQPEHIADMAAARSFLVNLFSSSGFSTQILPSQIHPAVYAQYGTDPLKPTVLIYGHYDVQPAGAPSQWTTPAFEPTIRKGRIYARGATDNKGQFMAHIMAASQIISKYGSRSPVNFKFLIEGEEEVGSFGVEKLVSDNRSLFAADYLFLSDTEMRGPNLPSIDISLRGVWDVEIHLQTASQDLHSGQFGGVAPNPGFLLTRILSKLKNGSEKVLIPGFYDDIVPPTEEELRDFKKSEPTTKQLMEEGHYAYIGGGESRYTLNRRRWAEPTLDITGLDCGYTGPGTKNIIPDIAVAKLSMRLVLNQDPRKIYRQLVNYLQAQCPKQTVLRVIGYPAYMPYKAPTDHPVFDLAKDVLKDTFGNPAVFQGQGGSIGLVPLLARSLNIPCVMIGLGLPDENLHSPNEHFSLENYSKGIEAMEKIYTLLPTLSAPAKPSRIKEKLPSAISIRPTL